MPRRNQPPARERFRPGSSRQRGRTSPAHNRPRIGQHFLKDPLIAHDIVDAAGLTLDDDVLEVGPGGGAITGLLLERAAHVTAVELDDNLAEALRRKYAGESRLTVIAASILAHPVGQLLAEGGRQPPYVVVANLPFYITAPVMRYFLEEGPRPRRFIVMVQREVAESIAGKRRGLSLLGVSVQVFASVEVLFRVPPPAFDPPPKVDSAVIRLDVYSEPLIPEQDLPAFFEVVRAGFRNPRKQMHNALSGGLWMPPGDAPGLLEAAEIDPMRRAGTLTIAEWRRLQLAYAAARAEFGPPPSIRSDNKRDVT